MFVRSLDIKKDPFQPREDKEEILDPKVPYLSAIVRHHHPPSFTNSHHQSCSSKPSHPHLINPLSSSSLFPTPPQSRVAFSSPGFPFSTSRC
ncbi:hypothetical protein SLEP1_g42457 [Rubroshorea leprosula]|uniref:Uncharacterized protein n=1 Tax=Rubroshorea leprosula TaxID=152421 RepID=A0AAV5LBA2_9ROSI|nr:hypothetical protein SLEP1_g42457 [Rubroshorea leprosula]